MIKRVCGAVGVFFIAVPLVGAQASISETAAKSRANPPCVADINRMFDTLEQNLAIQFGKLRQDALAQIAALEAKIQQLDKEMAMLRAKAKLAETRQPSAAGSDRGTASPFETAISDKKKAIKAAQQEIARLRLEIARLDAQRDKSLLALKEQRRKAIEGCLKTGVASATPPPAAPILRP